MITIEKNDDINETIVIDTTPERTEQVVVPMVIETYTYGSMKADLEAVETEIFSVNDYYMNKHSDINAEHDERLGKLESRKEELENKISNVENLLSQ